MERNDLDVLKNIVNMVLVTDIHTKKRMRYVVEGRMIFSKILREYGYTLNRIGGFLGKDHTTIIHYIHVIDKLLDVDFEILNKYTKCREMFIVEKEPSSELTTEYDLKNEIFRLSTKIAFLINENTLLKEKMANLKKDLAGNDKRLNRIVNFIDENTPAGHEFIVERKIRNMFDE
jgi:hypothetical protein